LPAPNRDQTRGVQLDYRQSLTFSSPNRFEHTMVAQILSDLGFLICNQQLALRPGPRLLCGPDGADGGLPNLGVTALLGIATPCGIDLCSTGMRGLLLQGLPSCFESPAGTCRTDMRAPIRPCCDRASLHPPASIAFWKKSHGSGVLETRDQRGPDKLSSCNSVALASDLGDYRPWTVLGIVQKGNRQALREHD
jgi:hypothetical protein